MTKLLPSYPPTVDVIYRVVVKNSEGAGVLS